MINISLDEKFIKAKRVSLITSSALIILSISHSAAESTINILGTSAKINYLYLLLMILLATIYNFLPYYHLRKQALLANSAPVLSTREDITNVSDLDQIRIITSQIREYVAQLRGLNLTERAAESFSMLDRYLTKELPHEVDTIAGRAREDGNSIIVPIRELVSKLRSRIEAHAYDELNRSKQSHENILPTISALEDKISSFHQDMKRLSEAVSRTDRVMFQFHDSYAVYAIFAVAIFLAGGKALLLIW